MTLEYQTLGQNFEEIVLELLDLRDLSYSELKDYTRARQGQLGKRLKRLVEKGHVIRKHVRDEIHHHKVGNFRDKIEAEAILLSHKFLDLFDKKITIKGTSAEISVGEDEFPPYLVKDSLERRKSHITRYNRLSGWDVDEGENNWMRAGGLSHTRDLSRILALTAFSDDSHDKIKLEVHFLKKRFEEESIPELKHEPYLTTVLDGFMGIYKKAKKSNKFAEDLARSSGYNIQKVAEIIDVLNMLPDKDFKLPERYEMYRALIDGIFSELLGRRYKSPEWRKYFNSRRGFNQWLRYTTTLHYIQVKADEIITKHKR